MRRILADILLFASALFLPWWITILAAFACFFLFQYFVELIIIGFLLDVLFGVPLPRFGGFQFVLSVISVLFFGVGTFLKRRMRVYH